MCPRDLLIFLERRRPGRVSTSIVVNYRTRVSARSFSVRTPLASLSTVDDDVTRTLYDVAPSEVVQPDLKYQLKSL